MESNHNPVDAILDKESFRKTLLLYRSSSGRDLEVRLISRDQNLLNWAEYDISPSELPWKALEQAIFVKDVSRIEKLFQTWAYDTSILSPSQRRAELERLLFAAVSSGDRATVKLLLSKGVQNLSSYGLPRGEPLITTGGTFEEILDDIAQGGQSAFDRQERLFGWLLRNGANPNPSHGYPPLLRGAAKCSSSAMQLLFDSGAEFNDQAIFWAVRRYKGDPEKIPVLRLLIQHGADVNLVHPGERLGLSSALRFSWVYRYTPLILAIQLQDVDTVEFLIQSGADVNLRWILNGEEKLSPLEFMLISENEELKTMGAYFQQLEE
ncbi:Ankyrin repeat-containing protein [Glarea lozoyensis ATCC 20868]|uniref:Ankyrin repeat-containing protein n=1 Tax=Glarea lozoyensis (strain ATCC 20868 / MF5171) TaxID=1116229 RepID=S3CT40_GLAL2|nr:Ankyrin repeat-containing protein [Glarea lozoyensis ATCC 20868]EPE28790.1 Ankyrin repeat-containing protein [Glarea lozoyensis ATCC 20868]